MGRVEYKIVEIEESTTKDQNTFRSSKPFAVPESRLRSGDQVTRRVVEAVDYELAQGSMPA